jgi:hypothetical protein
MVVANGLRTVKGLCYPAKSVLLWNHDKALQLITIRRRFRSDLTKDEDPVHVTLLAKVSFQPRKEDRFRLQINRYLSDC